MDSGSDDLRVPTPGEAAEPGSEKPEDSAIEPEAGEPDEGPGCFTEEELNRLLPPIPDWMRKPPPLPHDQPSLFEDE